MCVLIFNFPLFVIVYYFVPTSCVCMQRHRHGGKWGSRNWEKLSHACAWYLHRHIGGANLALSLCLANTDFPSILFLSAILNGSESIMAVLFNSCYILQLTSALLLTALLFMYLNHWQMAIQLWGLTCGLPESEIFSPLNLRIFGSAYELLILSQT